MGGVVTEGSFIPPPRVEFIESPYGHRYVQQKPKAVYRDDVTARLMQWAFTIRGYVDYGTFTLGLPNGVTDGEVILQSWYSLVRDMAKKALKYKHLPSTLTDTDMLIYWLDVYHYVLANLTAMLCANRLGQYNQGFAYLTTSVSTYVSRLSRLWRRLSAVRAPNFLKAHAIRDGLIVNHPRYMAPTLRHWAPTFLLASGSGGPGITAINADTAALYVTGNNFATFVRNLEIAEQWLENGTAAIATDFLAMKDLMDMTQDIVPGTFEPGLPDQRNLPGIATVPTVTNDILRRAIFRKDVVASGTDRWLIFPIPGEALLGERVAITGFGELSKVYDFTLLGAPKFGCFNSGITTKSADVDSDVRIPGTDFWLRSDHDSQDIRDIFGMTSASLNEEHLTGTYGSIVDLYDAFDTNDAAAFRDYEVRDSLRRLHVWDRFRVLDREAWTAGWHRLIEEGARDYMFYAQAEDFGENYGEFLAEQLGIPYL
jgi:hypothetical protein